MLRFRKEIFRVAERVIKDLLKNYLNLEIVTPDEIRERMFFFRMLEPGSHYSVDDRTRFARELYLWILEKLGKDDPREGGLWRHQYGCIVGDAMEAIMAVAKLPPPSDHVQRAIHRLVINRHCSCDTQAAGILAAVTKIKPAEETIKILRLESFPWIDEAKDLLDVIARIPE